ncbi:hypothetical protein MO973_02380 [Paenibacillus sp. TRM 82003]|nr:hypothetical protein [Paenibacillus sp. TRM 82003]
MPPQTDSTTKAESKPEDPAKAEEKPAVQEVVTSAVSAETVKPQPEKATQEVAENETAAQSPTEAKKTEAAEAVNKTSESPEVPKVTEVPKVAEEPKASDTAKQRSTNDSKVSPSAEEDAPANASEGSAFLAQAKENVENANPSVLKEGPVRKTWEGDNTLTFGELYGKVSVRGLKLSDKVEGLTGQEVEMKGYMAPPLTAEVNFFVLTKVPLAVCPFCATDADWPTDIVLVYMPEGEAVKPTEHVVKVTGTLDTGSMRDEETGFVSLIRIYADKVEVQK